MNYRWDWSVFWAPNPDGAGTYFDALMDGLLWTVITALCAWVIAFVMGSAIGVTRTLPSAAARRATSVYIEVFRNIPLLVQLFLWFYVIPELVPQSWGAWIKSLRNGPFYTASLGIGLYMSSRVASQVAAGIQSLPSGQRMAAAAMGLTTLQSYRYILLPMAYRVILPPLTSEFLNTIKNTAVGLTIGLVELTARARAMQEFTFQVFEPYVAAVVIYLALNAIVTLGMRALEHRMTIPGLGKAA